MSRSTANLLFCVTSTPCPSLGQSERESGEEDPIRTRKQWAYTYVEPRGRRAVASALWATTQTSDGYRAPYMVLIVRVALSDVGGCRFSPADRHGTGSLRQEWRESQRTDEYGIDHDPEGG